MSNKPHFFTDPANLDTQTQAYGPVAGSETIHYLVTSKLQFSTASDAIAVCSGNVFIQEHGSDNTLVNLVLIPTESLVNGFTPVKYFIYRGLKKDNILDNSDNFLDQSDVNASDFVKDTWAMFNAIKALSGISATTPSNKIIGWDKNANSDLDKLDPILSAKDNDFQLAPVAGGRTLSKFDLTRGGFEIVLLDTLFAPTLEHVRASEFKIKVSTPDSNDIPGNEPISRMRQREYILNFVDPAAWYMLFYENGVEYRASASPAIGLDQIYELLTTFQTRNTLYVDIRNENGYSLNYYKDNEGQTSDSDYGEHIQISWDGTNFTPINYYTNYWPILTLAPTNNFSGYNQLNIKFRKLYNPEPLVYADYAHHFEEATNPVELIKSGFKFLEEPKTDPMPTLWSNAITLTVPNRGYLPNSTQLSWIIRLTNLRLSYPTTTPMPPASTVAREKFLDNFFGPILPLSELFGSTSNSQWISLPQKRFMYAEGLGGMYAVTIGKDSTNIYYCAHLVESYQKSEINLFPQEVNDLMMGSGESQSGDLYMELNKDIRRNNLEFKKHELTLNAVKDQTLIVQPANLDFDPIYVPEVISLTMTITQFNDLGSLSTPTLNRQYHEVLLQFSGFIENLDDTGMTFYTTEVIQLVGLDSNGIYNSINTSMEAKGLSKIVLSTDVSLSNVLVNEQDRKTVIDYSKLINYLQHVDYIYKSKLNYDPSPNFTVTRLRAHSFGYPGRPFSISWEKWRGPFEAIGFTSAVPNAPYLETKPEGVGVCPVQGEPFRNRRQAILGFDLFCRIRMLYRDELVGKSLLESNLHILKDIYDDLLEMEVMQHQGIFIDIGHALYGLDALLHPGLDGKPASFYQNEFNLQHALDFASFIGDIASVLTWAYEKEGANPSNATFDLQFTLKFSISDVYADVDAYGLKAAYDVVSADSSKGLADVFEHYYGAGIPSDPTTHYSKRFTRFALDWDLIDSQGNWKGKSSSHYLDIVQRTLDFAKFLYFASVSLVDSFVIFSNMYYFESDISHFIDVSEAPNYSTSHAEYVVNKFLDIIRTGYLNE